MRFLPLLLLLAALAAGRASAAPVLAELRTDRARYAPGEPVEITVTLAADAAPDPVRGSVALVCRHLDRPAPGAPAARPFRRTAGRAETVRFVWQPPKTDFQGYLVKAEVRDAAGRVRAARATAVDVSSSWVRFPRCGFIAEYPAPDRAASEAAARQLADFHLNGLQFYDWQYRHHRPLAGSVADPAPSWKDIANRTVYRQTVLDQIDAAHRFGMAALNYNLLYGAWAGCDSSDGVDPRWGLKNAPAGGEQDSLAMPSGWATPAILLMNPGNADWQRYLFARESDVFAAYPFDGWQVDQVGDRGLKYDAASGAPVDVWKTFAPFLKNAKAALPGKEIVFNNVGGYGLYDVAANSGEDAVYVECWEPGQRTYADLQKLIEQCADWSRGKGVILAAYMDRAYGGRFSAARRGRFRAPGVLLTDAVIFASGGSHIEIGDDGQMLDHEYFPNHNLQVSPALRESLRRYYDFLTAYENLLRGGLRPKPSGASLRIPASGDGSPGAVWTFARRGDGCEVLHLINLIGESRNDWRDSDADYPAPAPQTNVVVKYHAGGRTVRSVAWASPDTDGGAALAPLPFTRGTDAGGAYVAFTLPALAYWDMVCLRF